VLAPARWQRHRRCNGDQKERESAANWRTAARTAQPTRGERRCEVSPRHLGPFGVTGALRSPRMPAELRPLDAQARPWVLAGHPRVAGIHSERAMTRDVGGSRVRGERRSGAARRTGDSPRPRLTREDFRAFRDFPKWGNRWVPRRALPGGTGRSDRRLVSEPLDRVRRRVALRRPLAAHRARARFRRGPQHPPADDGLFWATTAPPLGEGLSIDGPGRRAAAWRQLRLTSGERGSGWPSCAGVPPE
jgi:hypothetical protein